MTSHHLSIRAVKAHTVEIPLKKEWRISLYAARRRAHCVVEVCGDDGVSGFGEVAPSPAFMGEDGVSAADVVTRHLASAIKGRNAFDLAGLHAAMDRAIYGNGAAKAAVDIAVHDLLGRHTGLPVWALLGGQVRRRITAAWVIGIKELSEALGEVERFRTLGVSTFKIKLGRGPKKDVEFLQQLCDAYPDLSFRVDFNQGYAFHEALPLLKKIDPLGLDAIEQPVPAWDLEGLARLSAAIDTPIMADESVFSLHDAAEVVRLRAARILNIKVGKVGGLFRARQIAALAESSGLACSAGSNLELAFGTAASIHFAAATQSLVYPSDLAIGAYLHEWDIGSPSVEITNGSVLVPSDPGLGVNPEIAQAESDDDRAPA